MRILNLRLTNARILLVAVGALALLSGANVSRVRAAGSATVMGRVYWDANANGALDTGERAIQTRVDLVDDTGGTIANSDADATGNYRIEIAPGTYRLKTYVQRELSLCVDGFMATNSPFPAGGCFLADFPITSPDTSAAFTIAAGATRREDFAVTAKDQMVIIAETVEEGGYPPPGTIMTARVRGKACGSAVAAGSAARFALYVEGAGSVAGCAAPGDTVQFEMNGRTAGESVQFKRFLPGSTAVSPYLEGRATFLNMAFAEDWMWLWSDNLAFANGRPVPAGARVVARIGQAGCGLGVNTSDLNSGGSIGFARLFVPSERISIGCGKAGAQVDLVAMLPDRDEVIASFPWKPGVKQIGGPGVPPPTAVATPAPPVIGLPHTGTDGASPSHPVTARVMIVVISLLAGAAAAGTIARSLGRR
jgi:hypothetical protein